MKNINNLSDKYMYKLKYFLIGYLDDTMWFASSLTNLSTLLSAGKPFYEFLKMKVNFHKFKIISNITEIQNIDIPINITDTTINIKYLILKEIE